MSNWNKFTLEEVAEIKLSNVDKKEYPNQQKIRLCNYTDVYKNTLIDSFKAESFMYSTCSKNEFEKFQLKKNQVAITKDSEKRDDIGISSYIAEDFEDVVLGYHLSLITPKSDKLDGKFLNYWFNTKQAKIYFENNAGGSGQRCTLPLNTIKSTPLYLPNLHVQKQISKILYDLDSKIEVNNKINAELEAMAKTLYDYWFVQFDFPSPPTPKGGANTGKPYKTSGGKMVWNEELKREIPEGWEVKELDKCIELIIDHRGKTPMKLGGDWTNDNNGIIALSAKIVKGGKLVNLEQANRVSQELYNKWMSIKLQNGDILMTSEAPAGEFYFIYDFTEYCLSQRLFALRAKIHSLIPSYLYYELSKGHGYSQIKGSLSGSTVFGIRQDVLRKIKLVVPEYKLQEKFNKKVLPMLRQIKKLDQQNQELASLRDWLLPMLMNGQVSVGEVVKEYQLKEEVLGMVAEPKVINLTPQDKKVRRKMLATFIVNQSLSDTSFGKTKFEKLLHLVEYHLLKNDFNQRYSVQTAGPYDGGFTKVFWDEVTAAKWFKFEELGNLKRVVAGENHEKSLKEYDFFSDDLKQSIRDFIKLFNNTNYEKAEIVSTLYAVWNNRLIKNELINDALIKNDFLQWDKQKARYKNEVDKMLVWMRKENIVPDGWGKYISRAKRR